MGHTYPVTHAHKRGLGMPDGPPMSLVDLRDFIHMVTYLFGTKKPTVRFNYDDDIDETSFVAEAELNSGSKAKTMIAKVFENGEMWLRLDTMTKLPQNVKKYAKEKAEEGDNRFKNILDDSK